MTGDQEFDEKAYKAAIEMITNARVPTEDTTVSFMCPHCHGDIYIDGHGRVYMTDKGISK